MQQEEYAQKISEIEFQANIRKANADSNLRTTAPTAPTSAIVLEQATTNKLTTINAEIIHRFSDQLVDFSSDQIKIMMDETNHKEMETLSRERPTG